MRSLFQITQKWLHRLDVVEREKGELHYRKCRMSSTDRSFREDKLANSCTLPTCQQLLFQTTFM